MLIFNIIDWSNLADILKKRNNTVIFIHNTLYNSIVLKDTEMLVDLSNRPSPEDRTLP